jgi:hypothetical protein
MFGEFPSPLPDGGGSLCAWRTRQSRRTHDKPSHGKSYLYSWPNCGHTTSFAVSQSWHTAQKKVTDGLTTRFAMCHHAGTRQSLIVCRVPGLGVGVSVGLAFVVCPVFVVCCSRQRIEFAVCLVSCATHDKGQIYRVLGVCCVRELGKVFLIMNRFISWIYINLLKLIVKDWNVWLTGQS